MPSSYDILINLQAKADEVKAAGAVVAAFVAEVQAVGPALTENILKGDAATQTLARDMKDVSTAATAAGTATAAGMNAGGKAAANAAKTVKTVGDAAEDAGKHAGGLREMFEQAFAFGIGNQIVEKLLEIPTRLVEGFTEAIHAGVEFNAEMETLGIGMAASMRQADPEHLLNFDAAQAASAVAMDKIREKANALGLDFKSLAETFQINLRVMTDAGITDLEQQINTVLNLTQAAASKGLSGFQAQRDIIDLLNGRGDRTIFSKELGISDDDIKTATAAGNLYQFLAEKLSAYSEAGAAAAGTFAAANQRLQNQLSQLEGAISKPLFDVLKKGANDVAAIIGQPAFAQSFGVLASQIASAATAAISFGAAMLPLLPTALELGKDVVALTVALGVGSLVTALSNAVDGVGRFASVLSALPARITAVLTAIGPAGAVIGAATLAWLALDHAFSEYEARARDLLVLVGQFEPVLASLRDQVGAAVSPDQKAAGLSALNDELTRLTKTQEELKRSNGDPEQIIKLGDAIKQVQNMIAAYDSLAGKKAAAARTDEQAAKYPGLAKDTQEEDDKQYEAGLNHIQQLAKVQGEFDQKRIEAANHFGLASTASYESIKQSAQDLRDRINAASQDKPAFTDTKPLEDAVNTYTRQYEKIKTVIEAARTGAEQASHGVDKYKPYDIDPNYNLNVQTADDLTTKLADAQKALATAQTANSQATRDNASSLRTSSSEAAKALQAYRDLQQLHAKLTDTNKAATTERLEAQREDVQGQLAAAQRDAGPGVLSPRVQALQTESKELQYQLEYLRTHNQLDQQGIEWAKQRAAAEVENTVAKKEGVAATKAAHAEEREEHQDYLAQDKERQTAVEQVRDRIQEIQKNPFTPESQKEDGEKKLLLDELALIKDNIAWRQKLIDLYKTDPAAAAKQGVRSPTDVATLEKQNVGEEHQAAGVNQQLQGMTLGGQITKQLSDLSKQWGTVQQQIGTGAKQIASTLVDGIGNALTGLLTGTKNLGQAFSQIGTSIVGDLIKIGVQMEANSILSTILGKANAVEQVANNAIITASAVPAAAATSVASFWAYGVSGSAAALAAISAIEGAFSGAFAEGGLIAGHPSHKDNRWANVATGEYIVRTAAVQHYGPAFFHALNDMRVGRSSFATGGMVGGNDGYVPIFTAGSPSVSVAGHQMTLVQVRDRSEMLRALQSAEGRKIVIGHVSANRTEIGIRS